MEKLPHSLKRYFWDTDFLKLRKKNHSQFIIERILEYGDEKAVKWLKNNFDIKEIKRTLYNSRNISFKSANFWQLVFNINRNKILCLKKSFQEKLKPVWKY